MQKIIVLLFVLVTIVSICACGEKEEAASNAENQEVVADDAKEETSAGETLELTEAMETEIHEKIENPLFLAVMLTVQEFEYEDHVFTDLQITEYEKSDPYTYTAYGVLYATDGDGADYQRDVVITFTAVENAEEESGFSIDWNLEYVE